MKLVRNQIDELLYDKKLEQMGFSEFKIEQGNFEIDYVIIS